MKLDSKTPLNITDITTTIADTLYINKEKVSYNPIKKEATITLKRNRHVTICTHQLEELKRKFNCYDIIISTPYRCVLNLKFWYKSETKNHCCCGKCKK